MGDLEAVASRRMYQIVRVLARRVREWESVVMVCGGLRDAIAVCDPNRQGNVYRGMRDVMDVRMERLNHVISCLTSVLANYLGDGTWWIEDLANPRLVLVLTTSRAETDHGSIVDMPDLFYRKDLINAGNKPDGEVKFNGFNHSIVKET